jgi:capsular polysaccharide transport system permease protein
MSLEIDHAVHNAEKAARNTASDPISLSKQGRASRLLGLFFTKRNSLIFFVMMPSLIAAIYYFFIASGQYISETRMVVRTIGVSEQFDTSEKREGRSVIGGDSLTQDSYIVANYLKAPQIVRKLDAEIGLRGFFSRDGIDALSRLSRDASFEDLHKYWTRHVDTYVDGPSGIIIFTVRAFSPEESVAISKAALAASNEMIDKISEKAKKDLVGRGEQDVMASLEDYRKALDDLRDYQNKTGILDPTSSARMASAIIGKLTEEKLGLAVDLKSLEAAKVDNTARGRQLRRSIQALDDQIQLRQNSLAGQNTTGETQLSSSLIEFSSLETRRIVTQAIYEATVRNLDTAKSAALKRTTFMSIFSDSHMPEKSEYPDRFSEWIVLTAGLFTLWVAATLIWMSIEDHRV